MDDGSEDDAAAAGGGERWGRGRRLDAAAFHREVDRLRCVVPLGQELDLSEVPPADPGCLGVAPTAERAPSSPQQRQLRPCLARRHHLLGHAGVEVTAKVTAKVYAHAMPRGALVGWTPPPGLRGLDLLEAWYDRDEKDESDGASGARTQEQTGS